MVICRFYQQGNCEYEQYCQFEHVNNFGNKGENYNEDEFAAAVVANEVVLAERGGQWLLSCFGPFKEKPCIPGMEDLSPEEVRWEMYQAEKSGMGQQAKLRFQQLCQDMKTKRDALKNPNSETITMLKELMGTTTKSTNTTAKSAFSLATPQLGLPNSTSSSNVFGNKTFGTQSNPFNRSFATSTSNPIFGRPSQTSANPIFGGNPTFGNSLGTFGKPSTSSVFGGTTNSLTFNTGQNTQNFGSITSQSNSVFGGGTTQPVFGQASVFGGSNQTNNMFARPQTSQATTSVFDSNATAPNPIFGAQIASQPSTLFGAPKTSTSNPFGGSTPLQTTSNSVFGATTSAPSFSSRQFPASKLTFGGAPIFGAASGMWNNSGSIFGGQGTFAGSTNNPIFGGGKTAAPAFGTTPATNAFGATTTTVSHVFGSTTSTGPVMSAPNTSPFATTSTGPVISAVNTSPFATTSTGPVMSVPNTSPFATTSTGPVMSAPNTSPFATPTTSTPFATPTSQFDAASTANNLFLKPTFGLPAMSTVKPFSTTVTSSSTPFGNASTGLPFGTSNTAGSPFTNSTFGNLKSSPFASTHTTTTTTTANPFAPRNQQTMSPFGNPIQTQGSNTVTVSSSPFSSSPFGSAVITTAIIDDSVYSEAGVLTDDEKSMYLAEKFILGKIPLTPPSKDIR